MGFRPPGECPACGHEVPAKARACPECGADERSGWSDDAEYAHLDLPGEEEPVASDRDPDDPRPRVPKFWLWTAAAMAIVLILMWVVLPLLRH